MSQRRTRIKICGITRAEDALQAAELGSDAIGFVFVSRSARHVDLSVAADIAAQLPAFVVPVGLFLNAPAPVVAAALERIPRLLPQFHGTETAGYCDAFGVPYLKALSAVGGVSGQQLASFQKACAFLFDSHEPGGLGGTGHRFDWQLLPQASNCPLVLAGGLDADNVADAIAEVQPWAVDVSSGVESSKGIKCAQRMHDFIDAVRHADARVARREPLIDE